MPWTSLPENSALHGETFDYIDAYALPVVDGATPTPVDLMRAFFLTTPWWVQALMRLRNFLGRLVGLKTIDAKNVDRDLAALSGKVGESIGGLFPVRNSQPHELICGEADKHLDFWISFHVATGGTQPMVTLTTAVKFRGRAGRLYFAPVKPFHRLVVPVMLRRMLAG